MQLSRLSVTSSALRGARWRATVRNASTLEKMTKATAPKQHQRRREHPAHLADVEDDVPRLAKQHLHRISLADLVK
jgi:hypothetical protein